MTPLAQLILSRIREFLREPAAIFWVYGFPLVMAFVLATAFPSRPVPSIKVDVVGTDSPTESLAKDWSNRALKPKLDATVHTEDDALRRLRTAKTSLVVYADPTAPTGYRLVADESQPGSVLARAAVESLILHDINPKAQMPEVKPLGEVVPDTTGGRYIDFLFPGLIGTNLMGGGLFGVGFLIVDMRVRKLLKRYLATPMKKSDFMLSIMLSRMLFVFTEIGIMLGVAHFPYFGLTVHGNWFVLIMLIVLGGGCFSGIGLLVASRIRTLESASGLMNAFMLPQWLVSGVFFSSDTFPSWSQWLIKALPLTSLNSSLRAVINDGAGFDAFVLADPTKVVSVENVMYSPLVVLGAWGMGGFIGAIKLFKWR